MAETLLRKEIPVYSEKYDIHGVIKDYSFVTKLFFTHNDKKIEMGIHRNPMKGTTFVMSDVMNKSFGLETDYKEYLDHAKQIYNGIHDKHVS